MIRKSCSSNLSYGDTLGQYGVRFVAPNPFITKGLRTAFFLRPKCNKEFEHFPSQVFRGQVKSCCFLNRGERNKRIYKIWMGIKSRVFNVLDRDYKNYGGRGITLCKEWLDFYAFQKWALDSGYQDMLTIDRENNSLGYSPENCRWATSQMQARNRRNNVLWGIDGKEMCTTEAAKYLKISRERLNSYTRLSCRIPKNIADKVSFIIQNGENILPKLEVRPSDFKTGKP
jgi:hypothetical protein